MGNKPILCLDFDGVIHSYTSGWKGADVISDPPVDGFFEWAIEARKHFLLAIYSSRTSHAGGVDAMRIWLDRHTRAWFNEHPEAGKRMKEDGHGPLGFVFPKEKPAAFLTIDDRAICFDGTWPDPQELLAFEPWNKRTQKAADNA